jgi:membrane protease YdiL (CAAX protease family)
VIAWACFGAAGVLLGGAPPDTSVSGIAATAVLYLGTFAPSIVALTMTAAHEGAGGAAALFDRVFKADVAARWYVFAISYMLSVKLAVALIHRAALGAWPRFGEESWFLIAGAMLLSTPIQAGEEIGWRGYALPRLAASIGFAPASVVVGIAWGVWHAPLFYIRGLANYDGQSLVVFAAGAPVLSVAMAWLYANTGGSVLLTMLMHAAGNQTTGIVPSKVPGATNPLNVDAPVAWLTAAVMWIAAVFFLVSMRRTKAVRDQANGRRTPTPSATAR